MPNDSKADAVKKARRDKKQSSEEQRAARDVQVQQRGGVYSDRVRVDPFTRPYFYRHEVPSSGGPLKKA